MRVGIYLFSLVSLFVSSFANDVCENDNQIVNGCVSFSVTSGTGCAWMCNYCANQLGTNQYYFTDGVCSYQEGLGCVGNPISGKTYTCCSSTF